MSQKLFTPKPVERIGTMRGAPDEKNEKTPAQCRELYNEDPEGWDKAMEAVRKEFGGTPSKMEMVIKQPRNPQLDLSVRLQNALRGMKHAKRAMMEKAAIDRAIAEKKGAILA